MAELCFYIYKGHKFTELELNDFLAEGGDKLYSKYGDIVFERTTAQSNACLVIEDVAREARQYQKQYQEVKKKIKYIDGEEVLEFKFPYIGVTSFLKGLTNKDNRLLTPEFREHSYWLRRIKDWKDPNKGFNKDEEELFGPFSVITENVTEDQLRNFLDEWDKGNDISNTHQTFQLIKQMKEKWEALGKLGTAIHDVLRVLFSSYGKDAKKAGKLKVDTSVQELLNLEFASGKGKYNEELLTKEHLVNIIEYAKKLKKELETKLNDTNLIFFPEFQVASKLAQEIPEKGDTVLGIIDLLVVDSAGNAHIIDYKASPKDSFDSAKQRSFWYQLGFYNRLLKANDIKTSNAEYQVMIAPIKMKGFKREHGVFKMDGVEPRDSNLLQDITINATLHEVAANLDEFLPEKTPDKFSATGLVSSVTEFNAKAFANISISNEWTDENIDKMIKRHGGIQENTKLKDGSKLKKYEITIFSETYTGNSPEDVYDKIKKYYTETLPRKRKDMIKHIHMSLKKGIKENTKMIHLPKAANINSEEGANAQWFSNIMGKYCNSSYEIIDIPIALEYGVILIKNKKSLQVDILKITTDNLELEHFFDKKKKMRSTVMGEFITDRKELRKSDSLALKATTGNIHLMETMAVLNCIPELANKNITVGTVQVANPHLLQGVSVGNNKELEYNFNELSKYMDDYKNNLKDKVRFASKVDLAYNRLQEILDLGEIDEFRSDNYKVFKQFRSTRTALDSAISSNDERIILRELEELRKKLESDEKTSQKIALNLEQYQQDEALARDLYDKVMLAIAELKGISFRQQTKDNATFLESMDIARNGVQSLMLDNPGNLNNDTLNVLTKLVSEAYQNVREDLQRDMGDIRDLVTELKKDKNFTKLEAMTTGNAASLYSNMIKHENGDILFKNPWDSNETSLTDAERKFLKYTITKINENRYNGEIEDLEKKRTSYDLEYFRVPLAAGDVASAAAVTGGLRKALKSKLKQLNPKVWWEEALKKLQGVFTDVTETSDVNKVFEMNNMFDVGQNTKERLDKIAKKGYEYFEHNLETLLLKHTFAYSSERNINTVMPTAKAAMIHLVTLGHLTNKQYTNATNYVTDYIRSKVKNESIIDPKFREANAVISQMKYAASLLVLGFSPIQYGYQMLQGLWTNIRVYFQHMGSENTPFTQENFFFAGKLLFRDFFKLGNKPTKCSLINEYFGFNDMDMNTYADKIKSDLYGIFNISNIAFHGASRPDFYNRMLLFIAQMKKDGVWEAYTEKNGRLKYDYKSDKRFSAYANGDMSDMKLYREQQGLYASIANQLVLEHARKEDGTLFEFGDDLPKAYSNKQIEDFKAFSDDIYGYYAHEKKSMIHAMSWGALWMQMRNYWSGKKNMYLGAPGIKLRGKFVHYHEVNSKTGEKTPWFLKEENGRMVPTKEKTEIPFMKWEGDWQEGVFMTLAQLWHDSREFGFKTTWEDLWTSEDRIELRQNIIQLAYDTTMFVMIGPLLTGVLQDWDDELEKDADNVDEAAVAAAAHVAMKIVSSSFGDFNFVKSIGLPFYSWTPFSFAYFGRKFADITDVCMGDKSFTDFLLRIPVATSSTKIFWDALLDNNNKN